MNALLVLSIIKHDIETSRHRNDKLMKFLMRMPTALRTARYVIQVIDTLDIKGYMVAAFDESQVAAWILNLWKVNKFAEINAHALSHLRQARRNLTGTHESG